MTRFFTLSLLSLAGLAGMALAREFSQDQEHPPDDRQAIIKRLRRDYEAARQQLQDKNPGATTRQLQQNIIDDLKRLEEESSEQSGNPMNKPKETSKNPPAPKASTQPKENLPAPKAAVKPQEKSKAEASSSQPPSEAKSRPVKEAKPASRDDLWSPELPPRHREVLDSIARDRFPRDYQEVLRAYYRTLAQSGRRKAAE